MENQDKINATLNLSSKNITDDSNIFKELISSYPNVINLNLSDNQLTLIPDELLLLTNLKFLDIQGNPFNNVTKIILIYFYFYFYSLIKLLNL